MKLSVFLLSVLLFTGCVIPDHSVLRENSNASMIEKSIQNLQVADNLKSYLNKNENIIIVPIEAGPETFEHPYLAIMTGVLQDNLTREFVSLGYKVLERDFDMTYRLISESEDTYKHNHFLYASDGRDASKTTRINKAAKQKDPSVGQDGFNTGKAKYEEGETQEKIEIKTTLTSADKIISYRIVDCGIRYDKNIDSLKMKQIARDARTILEVRVTDAKTSKISAAVLLDGRSQDIIDEIDKKALQDFDYKPYHHSYPNYYITEEQTTGKKRRSKGSTWLLGGLGFIILLMAAN
ncbi:MAG: hypothetical protein VX347_00440 [Bacteroidota bacterium]|nr:hypothetical protein [Bacteroidota bacterium]